MKYVLDTDIISYFIKGDLQVSRKILMAEPNSLFTTSVNCSELLFGVMTAPHNSKKLLKDATEFLETVEVIDFDRRAAEIFASLKADLTRKGQIIKDLDLMIAAVTLANNAILVTNNTKHFERIKKLKIANWKN